MAKQRILDEILRDITTFADPSTDIAITSEGLTWQQGRVTRFATFSKRATDDYPDITVGESTLSYRSFLASTSMADLRSLAESINQMLPSPAPYVEPMVVAEQHPPEPASQLLARYCTSDLPFRTRVVFLRGPAGSGKTVVLRRLAARQANAFLAGQAQFLFFYVDAQGMSLSRLDQAIATTLQDLRAKFTYHAVETLTRLHLLVPIIDGFDELLGVGGYQEAFSSLVRLLGRLRGEGALIASARSAFYDFSIHDRHSLLVSSRLAEDADFELVPVDLQEWTERETLEYLKAQPLVVTSGAAAGQSVLPMLRTALGPGGEFFLRTPFFVAQLVDLLQQGGLDRLGKRRLTSTLVTFFVDREVAKLRSRNGLPLLAHDQHMLTLEMLAEEMWWESSRSLDEDTVKSVAELACERFQISADDTRAFVTKSPSYGFLRSEHRPHGRVELSFHHEFYFSYFLGRALGRALSSNSNLAQWLARETLTELLGQEVAHALSEVSAAATPQLVATRLADVQVPQYSRDILRTNSGLVVAGLITVLGDKSGPATVENCAFVNVTLRDTRLSDWVFHGCDFVRVNLAGAAWHNVRFDSCTLSSLGVSEGSTSLSGCEVSSDSVVVGVVRNADRGMDSSDTVYAPEEVQRLLTTLGALLRRPEPAVVIPASGPGPETPSRMKILRRILRLARKLYNISESDLENIHLRGNTDWEAVRDLLQTHGLLKSVEIHRRGPSAGVLRLTVHPDELEAGESGVASDPRIASFWTALRSM